MNFRTQQICSLCTESDSVYTQRETDSTHVSHFQLFLFSKFADFGHHFEILTNGVERFDGILEEDVPVFTSDVFEVLLLLH